MALSLILSLQAFGAVLWGNPLNTSLVMTGATDADVYIISLVEACPGETDVVHSFNRTVDLVADGLELPEVCEDGTLTLNFDPFVINGSSWQVEVLDSSATVTPSANAVDLSTVTVYGSPGDTPSILVTELP